MDIISWIFIVLFVLGALTAVVFFFGPTVLEIVAEKAEEWEGILDAIKGGRRE